MAKEKKFTLQDLNSELSKLNEFATSMNESTTSQINDWLNTGNYILNACISGDMFKGIPGNRITSFAGPSSTGKTFLSLNACLNAQQQGYDIVYYDTENAIDKPLVEKFGIDTSRINHVPVGSIEKITNHVANMIEVLKAKKDDGFEIPKILFVVDSLGNLSTTKEKADVISGSDKADMTRAKGMKRFFRVLTTELAVLGLPLIFTNHTYKDISAFFPTDIPSGGCLGPDELVKLKDGETKSISDVQVGDEVITMTSIGYNKVTKTHSFEKESYEIEFEDGSTMICSSDHLFLKDEDFENKESWIRSNELKPGDYVLKKT